MFAVLVLANPFDPPPSYSPIAPAYESGTTWPKIAGASSATVTIGSTVLRNSTPYALGTNVPVYWGRRFSRDADQRAQLAAGPQFLRWPGGTPANEYVWSSKCVGTADTTPCWKEHPYFLKFQGQYGSAYLQTPDEFITTCKAVSCIPLVQANAAIALVESVANATAMALDLLRYLKQGGLDVRHVAFGNENYGPWEVPYGDVPVDGELYGNAFTEWVEGMRREFPDVAYGVVGLWTPGDGAATTAHAAAERCARAGRTAAAAAACTRALGLGYGVIENWMPDLLSKTDAVRKADFLILHDYFDKATDEPAPSAATLIERDLDQLHAMRQGVADFISNSTAPTTPMPPLVLTEFQVAAAYASAGNATETLASAVFLASVIGETLAAAPVNALTEFAWHAKWFSKGNRSGGYGSYAFGHPDPSVPEGTLAPKYYASWLWRKALGGTVLAASSSTATLKVYATRFAGGEHGLVLINTDEAAAASVTLAGVKGRVNGWVLSAAGGGTMMAPVVAVNGVDNGLSWGAPWPPPAPYAAASDAAIDVPPASVTAVIVYA